MPTDESPAVSRALELVDAMGMDPAVFGRFQAVPPDAVPDVPRRLLDHRSHMTVAMERFWGGPVALRVVAERPASVGSGGRYVREILLVRGDGTIVQHGIVRIDLAAVPAPTVAAIRERRTPLGRILIDAGLLCDVQNVQLLEVAAGPHLAALFGGAADAVAFGRVAEIRVAGATAVELLEIVPPA
jgi:chorismate-pyruvate lyase